MTYITWVDGFGCEYRSFVLATFWDEGWHYAVIRYKDTHRVLLVKTERTRKTSVSTELMGVL